MSFARNLLGRLRLPRWNVRGWVSDHREGLARAGRVALFWSAFAGVVLLIHRQVYSFIMHRKECTNQSKTLHISLAPDWARKMGQDSEVVLGADGSGGEAWDPSAPDAPERLGHKFEANPWIKRVESVEREYPDQLRVKLDYRKPHAAVRRSEGYVAVDDEGVRLPGIYSERPPVDLMVDITGLDGALPAAGTRWTDAAYAAGLELAELAAREPLLQRAGVTAVDVSNFEGRISSKRSEIVLRTESGALVLWGRPLSTKRFGELSADEKLVNLSFVLEAYPHLDGLKTARLNVKGAPSVQENESRISIRRR